MQSGRLVRDGMKNGAIGMTYADGSSLLNGTHELRCINLV